MNDLSDAQRAFVNDPGDLFVEACPGAGKTRAITRRFKKRVEDETYKGIALVSFTNVAVDAAKERCVDAPTSLQAPNFVGTFDSFINRYLSGPLYVRQHGKPIEFIESWAILPSTMLRGRGYNIGIPLECFDFDEAGRASFAPDRARGSYKSLIIEQAMANIDAVNSRATALRNSLIRRGIVSCSASRWLASTWLGGDAERTLMGRLLSSRFAEIIVDEAQDCGMEELAVLTFLRSAGLKVTMVADRDQAIFEFRRATPDKLLEFAATLNPGIALDGNYRSTPAICLVNNSLRSGTIKDVAVGGLASLHTPVQLLLYKEVGEIAAKAQDIAILNSESPADMIILAHSRKLACSAAGGSPPSEIGDNHVVRIADAALKIREKSSNPRTRRQAIEQVQRTLIGLIAGSNLDDSTVGGASENAAVGPSWLRGAATRLVMAANPSAMTVEEFTQKIREAVGRLRWPVDLPLQPLNSYFRKPSTAQWEKLGLMPEGNCLRWGTVHSVKGQEFSAVTMVLPKKMLKDNPEKYSVLDFWEQDADSEARRVLYVGASRAQRLLVLAVYTSHARRVREILKRDQVPFAEWTLKTSTAGFQPLAIETF